MLGLQLGRLGIKTTNYQNATRATDARYGDVATPYL